MTLETNQVSLGVRHDLGTLVVHVGTSQELPKNIATVALTTLGAGTVVQAFGLKSLGGFFHTVGLIGMVGSVALKYAQLHTDLKRTREELQETRASVADLRRTVTGIQNAVSPIIIAQRLEEASKP